MKRYNLIEIIKMSEKSNKEYFEFKYINQQDNLDLTMRVNGGCIEFLTDNYQGDPDWMVDCDEYDPNMDLFTLIEEPEKVVVCTYMSETGGIHYKVKGSEMDTLYKDGNWKLIKEETIEVER